jgi:nucleoside-diphosphate-sugar epimerase
MSIHRTTILLTGASGVVGRALIDELSVDHDVVCLRHRTPIADWRVREVAGAVGVPGLGLSPAAYSALAGRVGLVLHAAASTNWKVDPEQIRQANVSGTANVARFAQDVGAPIMFVSTAFVADPPCDDDERFAGARAYIRSKIEAEQIVRDGGGAIIRPSVVIGDTRTGQMSAFQGLHRVAGQIARGLVPIIPCTPTSLTDVVPLDVLGEAIGRLVRGGVQTGEFWITAGDQALTAGDIVAASLQLGHALGAAPTSPRFIDPEAVDRLLLPLLDEVLTPALRRVFLEMLESTWLFQAPRPLPSSMVELGLADRMHHQVLVRAFSRSIAYWAKTKRLIPAPADYLVDAELVS